MKIKFNWGTGVAIAIGIIFLMIASLIYFSFSQRVDLVHENYYERELQYQKEIESENNSSAIAADLTVTYVPPNLEIRFPASFDKREATGEILFYKPNDPRMDFKVALDLGEGNLQKIPAEKVSGGRWKIVITFQQGGKSYKINKEITL